MFGRYNGIKYSGILGEVFEQFKDTFNFTYESVPSIDSFYGSEVSFLLWTDCPLSDVIRNYRQLQFISDGTSITAMQCANIYCDN